MTTLTQGKTPGDWLLYEGDAHYSRDVETITGDKYESGTPMGRVTATKKLVACDKTASDGSETAVGVLLNDVDASTADQPGIVIARHAQVRRFGLTWGAGITTKVHRDDVMADLKAEGIKEI